VVRTFVKAASQKGKGVSVFASNRDVDGDGGDFALEALEDGRVADEVETSSRLVRRGNEDEKPLTMSSTTNSQSNRVPPQAHATTDPSQDQHPPSPSTNQ
jgi:hypothetical protein